MFPEFEIFPAKKIAYLFIRKCGCSSIRHAISQVRDQVPLDQVQHHIHARGSVFAVPPDKIQDPQQWFKFTVVRDPIRRFFSFYAGKILDQNVAANHTFQRFDRFGYLPNMSVDRVVEILVSGRFETEPHLVPQAEFIRSADLRMDLVGHLENLGKCMDVVEQETGVRLEPRRLNPSKQLALIPTRNQFSRLAEFYREDIRQFGYPDNFDDWINQNIKGNETKFQMEPGFTFSGEAKLLTHQITKTSDGFLITMTWRVDSNHHRKRVVRIVEKQDSGFDLIWHLPPKSRLNRNSPDSSIVIDEVFIPIARIPDGIDLNDLYQELYFSDNNSVRAPLVDYAGHDNMLLFPLANSDSGLARSA